MIRQNLRPEDEFTKTARAYMLHPVTLYTYALPLIMLATGLIKPEFGNLGVPEAISHLLTAIKVGLFWLLSWLCLGKVTWFAMNRGIPFCCAPVGMWLLAVLASQGLSELLIPGFDWSGMRIIQQSIPSIPSTLIAVYATAPMLREKLGDMPELVPVWTCVPKIKVPLLLRLPAERRGRLRRIQAANQYVEVVTDKGKTLLRMSLRDAANQVPAEMGWLCHRSLWILREEVLALTYLRGQPQILDTDGESRPVSRTVAPAIREWLDRTK